MGRTQRLAQPRMVAGSRSDRGDSFNAGQAGACPDRTGRLATGPAVAHLEQPAMAELSSRRRVRERQHGAPASWAAGMTRAIFPETPFEGRPADDRSRVRSRLRGAAESRRLYR